MATFWNSFSIEKGTKFIQAFKTTNPITFEVLEIDREENSMRVLCTDSNGYSHEETWDGCDGVKQTEIQIEMGEYKVI